MWRGREREREGRERETDRQTERQRDRETQTERDTLTMVVRPLLAASVPPTPPVAPSPAQSASSSSSSLSTNTSPLCCLVKKWTLANWMMVARTKAKHIPAERRERRHWKLSSVQRWQRRRFCHFQGKYCVFLGQAFSGLSGLSWFDLSPHPSPDSRLPAP